MQDLQDQVTCILEDLHRPDSSIDEVLGRIRRIREQSADFDPLFLARLPTSAAAVPVGFGTAAAHRPDPVAPPKPEALRFDFPVEKGATWSNHQSTQVVQPTWLGRPRSLAELRALVTAAHAAGVRVRAFGTGHSYSDVAVTRDFLVDTSDLREVLPLPPLKPGFDESNYVHVEAGIKVWDVNAKLHAQGRALFILGGYTGQSVIGAVATGTHGSGLQLGNISAYIVSLVLVTEKEVLRVEPSKGLTDPAHYAEPGVDRLVQDDRYFNAIVVSMGCMGLVYSVIVRVRPSYLLEERRTIWTWSKLAPLLANRSIFASAKGVLHRHVEIWVNPHVTQGDHTALGTVRNEFEGTVAGKATQRNCLLALAERSQMAQDVFVALLNAFPRHFPGFLDSTLRSLAGRRYVNFNFRVLASDDTPDGFGCENALPMVANRHLEAIEETFRIAACEAENHGRYMSLLSLRFVKRSRAFLSPQYDAADVPTCMIEIPTLAKLHGAVEIFKIVSRAMFQFGGRPHWGLEFGVLDGIKQVREMYPRFDDWLAVYRELNPDGTFSNSFTARLGVSR